MKRFLVIMALLLFGSSVFAQQAGKITVTIIDAETKEGVQGAVVEISPASDPDSKRYYTSGYGGKVEITSLAYGDYKAVTSFLGYADLEKDFKVSSSSRNLGNWELTVSATRIETVVKEVKALRTSQDGDTLSYNAGAFKVANDADVEGLLKKMPGITINNGSVEAQGETVKKVFVDGKEFFGDDVNTAIKSLPAQVVDRIEVYNKLSDQAEFSGMDDGEGYKAINIVTHANMRQGQFGKLYAGYGYQPDADEVTSNHKYIAGGNVNLFHGDSRVSLLGLFNNINQQNFSFEDILGVSGGRGGGRGVGQYMVRPQSGVASVNAFGVNYSDLWGKKDQVKFQGSYFFNNTRTKNLSRNETWYESPAPVDTLFKQGFSNTLNNNHRLNARLDWTISENQSLMSRTGFSYQSNSPYSESFGYQFGESGLLYNEDYGRTKSHGWNFNEFLQYRVRLGKAGRTMTVDGNFRYSDNKSNRNISSNDAAALPYDSDEYNDYRDMLGSDGRGSVSNVQNSPLYDPIFQYITAPSRTYSVRGSVMYNEPLGKYFQLSLSYRVNYQNSNRDQQGFYTDKDWKVTGANDAMTNAYQSGYWTHNVGPGIRYSKDKNTFVANVSYQRSSLDGSVIGGQSTEVKKNFNNVLYFAMLNYAFNRENTIRLFFRSSTDAPSVSQLQNIYDVSTPQYLSVGNKDLNPAFNHSINFHYINSNVEKGRTFMWMFSMNTQQNYISGSTWYTGGVDVPVTDSEGLTTIYNPQRVTSYENMDGYWSLRTHLSFGVPLSFMKCNLNIMGGVNYNIAPSAIYGSLEDMYNHIFTTNKAKNIGYDMNVTLGSNISENIDFTLSWNGTYNQAWNTAAQGLKGNGKNNYFNHSASGSLKWVFWKGFTFTANCSYVQYLGITNDYNESYVLCNLYVGKKFLKNRMAEIQVGVNDVANQNTAFGRSTGSGFTQNSWNSVIGRYYSVQFVYNLRHFGKKGSTNTKDYDYNESSGGVGVNRGGGMRPMGPPPGMR